jgi:hypothetical protein
MLSLLHIDWICHAAARESYMTNHQHADSLKCVSIRRIIGTSQ